MMGHPNPWLQKQGMLKDGKAHTLEKRWKGPVILQEKVDGRSEYCWEGSSCSLKRRRRQEGGMLKEAGRPRAAKARHGSGSLP